MPAGGFKSLEMTGLPAVRFSRPAVIHTLWADMGKLSFNIDEIIAGRARLTDAQALELSAREALKWGART